MKGYLDNLRPFERRMVVGVGAVLFVVLNFWFVVPHFSDWTKVQRRMGDARLTVEKFNAEIAQKSYFEREVRKLAGEGLEVPLDDQAIHFQSAINAQQVQSGVSVDQIGRQTSHTNQFFLELAQPLTLHSKEPQLVDFLYSLGSGNSLIRVRDLTLRPDPPRQQLMATDKLVASYQKKPSARAAAAPSTAAPARPAPQVTKPAAPTPNPGASSPGKTVLGGKTVVPTNRPATSNTKRP